MDSNSNEKTPLSNKRALSSRTPPTPSPQSPSKVLIISPEQIAKLGLTQQINKAVQSQVKVPGLRPKLSPAQEVPRKLRVSKMTIINPTDDICTTLGGVKSKVTVLNAHVQNDMANTRKNKVSNLLKTQTSPGCSTSNFGRRNKTNFEGNCNSTRSESLGKKRKRGDSKLSNVVNNLDDDVILIDSPPMVVEEDATTEEIKEESTKTNVSQTRNISRRRSKLGVTPNTIDSTVISVDLNSNQESKSSTSEQPKKEMERNLGKKDSERHEDVKKEIHVLSNEQITLSPTDISNLKTRSPDKNCSSKSTSSIICKPHSSNNQNGEDGTICINDKSNTFSKHYGESERMLLKQETDCIASTSSKELVIVLEPLEIHSSTVISVATPKINSNNDKLAKELRSRNTRQASKLLLEIKNKAGLSSSKTSPHTEVRRTKTAIKLPLITETVIDLTDATAEESPTKNVGKQKISVEASPNRAKTNSTTILNFAAKIRNKMDVANSISSSKRSNSIAKEHEEYVIVEESDIAVKNPIKKTYSRKQSLPAVTAPSTTTLIKNEDKCVEVKDETKLKIALPINSETAYTNNNEAINTDIQSNKDSFVIINDEQTEVVKPLPKKRGSKKKSEMIKIVEVPEIVPEPILETSRRGRKRKAVNYCALAGGDDYQKSDLTNAKTQAKHTTSFSEGLDQTSGIVEIDTIISRNPDDNSINCTYTVQEISPIPKATPKRKRGRSPRIKVVESNEIAAEKTKSSPATSKQRNYSICSKTDNISFSLNESQNGTLNDSTVEPTEQTKNNTTDFSETEIEETSFIKQSNEGQSTTPVKRKRGKQRKDPIENSDEPSSTVICAVCNKEMPRTGWPSHKVRFHNNLAWRVGDRPLDLDNQKFVMSVLNEIYKRRKPLFCEKCGESKKSVLGYLSHKSMCQKSEEEVSSMRIQCKYCDRSLLPVSMPMHLKYCKGCPTNNMYTEEHNSESSFMDSPTQGKRASAKKADNLIKSLQDDDTEETTQNKSTLERRWHVNFDFRSTYFGKRHFRTVIINDGVIKCRFEGCKFETSKVEEISKHLFTCDKKPKEGYTCKYCIKTYKTQPEILQHFSDEHPATLKIDEAVSYEQHSEEEEEEEVEEDLKDNEEKKVNSKIRSIQTCKPPMLGGIKFLLKFRYCSPSTQIAFPPAVGWTMAFCKQNFSIRNLFSEWRTTVEDWGKLQSTQIINYLPNLKYSACTSFRHSKDVVNPLKVDHEWKRFKLFESKLLGDGNSIIFCGGPIFAMAWAPTPYDEKDNKQILAVSANTNADKNYPLDKKYSQPGLIQFWNYGNLSNETPETKPPKLEFCIAHNYGPIWHLEWCPSGCYDIAENQEDNYLQRLGILAAASANSHIYLYSVCSPGQISGKILKPKPILKLVVDSIVETTVNKLEIHVTKISWSKASGHQYLAAGYSNGIVAVYYLATTSNLLQLGKDENGIKMMMPYQVLCAHQHAITILSMYHLNNGKRWLLSGSSDRNIKYWDLENPTVPITNFTKYIATDGVWLNHWLSNVSCFDDSCAGGLTYSLAYQPRSFESDYASILHSYSCVMCVSGNEWLNGFVQGNVAGELIGFFPHQMFFNMDSDKSIKNKKVILGYARLVEKGEVKVEKERQEVEVIYLKSEHHPNDLVENPTAVLEPEPLTYKEAQDKYGLAFYDIAVHSGKQFSKNISDYYALNKSEKLYKSKPNVYPMQSITKVAFNPNHGSFSYIATGYQAGFVKLTYMHFFQKYKK